MFWKEEEEEGFVWRLFGPILATNVDAQSQKKRMKDEDIFDALERFFLVCL